MNFSTRSDKTQSLTEYKERQTNNHAAKMFYDTLKSRFMEFACFDAETVFNNNFCRSVGELCKKCVAQRKVMKIRDRKIITREIRCATTEKFNEIGRPISALRTDKLP